MLFRLSFSVEPPNGSIHRFNGSATIIGNSDPLPNVRSGLILELVDIIADKRQEVSLSEKNLILRGSVIRATEWYSQNK